MASHAEVVGFTVDGVDSGVTVAIGIGVVPAATGSLFLAFGGGDFRIGGQSERFGNGYRGDNDGDIHRSHQCVGNKITGKTCHCDPSFC